MHPSSARRNSVEVTKRPEVRKTNVITQPSARYRTRRAGMQQARPREGRPMQAGGSTAGGVWRSGPRGLLGQAHARRQLLELLELQAEPSAVQRDGVQPVDATATAQSARQRGQLEGRERLPQPTARRIGTQRTAGLRRRARTRKPRWRRRRRRRQRHGDDPPLDAVQRGKDCVEHVVD